MKSTFVAVIGIVGSFIAKIYGGWDAAMTTLVIFMGIDYVMGLVVAGVFKKSGKSENGALDSRAGFKGLLKKGTTLVMVLIGYRLDLSIGTTVIKNAVVIAYIANETISIIENAGLMGIPIPNVIKNAIDILKQKSDPKDGDHE